MPANLLATTLYRAVIAFQRARACLNELQSACILSKPIKGGVEHHFAPTGGGSWQRKFTREMNSPTLAGSMFSTTRLSKIRL
jgi:hypothetical protein